MEYAICNACHEDVIESQYDKHIPQCSKTYCMLCQIAFKPTDILAANGYIHFSCQQNLGAFSDKVVEIEKEGVKEGDMVKF